MPIHATCACGASYSVKDQFAGMTVKCPQCGAPVALDSGKGADDPVFARDKFLLRQKRIAISSKYHVWDEQENVLLYVERPAHLLRNLLALLGGIAAGGAVGALLWAVAGLLPGEEMKAAFGLLAALGAFAAFIIVAIALSRKRHIQFCRDESKAQKVLEIKQDKKVALLNATYTLNDADDRVLARFRKNYLYNVFRKRWYCYRPDGALWCVAKEDSLILSLLRRVLGPLFGILRVNFVILEVETDRVVGEFNRKMTLFDRYVLDMSADPRRTIDRRVAMAMGVLLDTGERR